MVRLFSLLCRSMNRFCKRLKYFPHDMRTYEKSRFRGGASKSSQSIREWGNPRRTAESLVLTHYTIPDGSFLLYSTLCILSSGFVSFLLFLLLLFISRSIGSNDCNTRLLLDHILKSEIGKVMDWCKVDKEDYLLAIERSPINEIANFLH